MYGAFSPPDIAAHLNGQLARLTTFLIDDSPFRTKRQAPHRVSEIIRNESHYTLRCTTIIFLLTVVLDICVVARDEPQAADNQENIPEYNAQS